MPTRSRLRRWRGRCRGCEGEIKLYSSCELSITKSGKLLSSPLWGPSRGGLSSLVAGNLAGNFLQISGQSGWTGVNSCSNSSVVCANRRVSRPVRRREFIAPGRELIRPGQGFIRKGREIRVLCRSASWNGLNRRNPNDLRRRVVLVDDCSTAVPQPPDPHPDPPPAETAYTRVSATQ